ncbi:MAG: YdcF family protein [Lachnospiraceae bacterium]|nr:YdcF family protein [Lachnospiraceae bacterium]
MTKSTIYLLNTAGVLSLIYFILIAVYSGIRTSFLWFWPFFSVCCAAASFLLFLGMGKKSTFWRFLTPAITACVWLSFLLLFSVEYAIMRSAAKEPKEESEYMIVLGAQVRGDKPSLTLQARIDSAAEYLTAHPQIKVICSGGQGKGENLPEALAIKNGLVAKGISPSRILIEDRSTNTVENLRFCLDLLPDPSSPTIIVTNDFHCMRAGLIAKKCGYANSFTLPAGQFLLTTPHYFIREFFALFKDFLFGNL